MCFCCGRTGHIAARCPDAAAKVATVDDEEQVIAADQMNVLAPASFHSVEVKAIDTVPTYPTCAPIMTQVKIADKKVTFECDTAASHNILSQESYQEIWRRGSGPKLQYHSVRVMLADGTRSQKQTRSMEAMVQATNGKKIKLQFFVMSGPNNLLGRLALRTIWPDQYGALKDVAEIPIKKAAAVPEVKVKSQLGSVVDPVAARADPDLRQREVVAHDGDVTTAAGTALPQRRKLPPPPTGAVT